jgi:NYN domain-containing protein/OST-HTH/LOTUS domain-containing protein
MASESRAARLAVLIDADNASPRIAEGLFEEIAKIGEASVRRIYGDFSGNQLKSWAEILAKHAIIPHQNFAYTTGKNASDIALVIDAMDLLHSGRFDGFCLVSSDSDFTRLAARIREQGIDVYGFGAQKTPESFRQACRRFIYTENLLPEAAPAERERSAATKLLRPPGAATALLCKAIAQMDDPDGWLSLGEVGKILYNLAPDFDARSYGQSKLIELVEKTGSFDVRRPDTGGVQIRLKPSPAKKTTKANS